MEKNSVPKSKVKIEWIFWGIIIAITLIWLIAQQIQINKFNAEIAEQEKMLQGMEEYLNELSSEDASLSDEEVEYKAQEELGLLPPGHIRVEPQ